jgi:hypothetical protein
LLESLVKKEDVILREPPLGTIGYTDAGRRPKDLRAGFERQPADAQSDDADPSACGQWCERGFGVVGLRMTFPSCRVNAW